MDRAVLDLGDVVRRRPQQPVGQVTQRTGGGELLTRVVETPMVAGMIGTEIQRAAISAMVPMPLNGFMQPEVPAYLLTGLVSGKNSHLCGQVIFIDGGADAMIRGDSTW
jgi:hypothetical protein